MRLSYTFLMLVTAAATAAACGGKPPAEQPTPVATVDTAAENARMRARQDSIDAANRARAEADRLAREAADRAAAAAARAAVATDLAAAIHFDFDQSDIRGGDMANLDRKAAILSANSGLQIRISGHADDRGSDEYNLALGNRRAAAAKRYLAGKGIADARITIVSFGEERPAAMGADENSWAQNRRDEFEIVSGGDNLVAPR
ncbi:MAG: OmpA family protein [Gemmatimonadota bacterium]